MSDRYSFHVNLYREPTQHRPAPQIQLRGIQLTPLRGIAEAPPVFDHTMTVSFETAQERLLTITRMDVEPDGYFLVAGGEAEGDRWQIDGHLYELGGGLHRVELSGSCPKVVFDELLRCIGWPDAELVFELVREGVTLSETDFREWAEQSR